jgi:hypothetical protein
MDQRPSTKVTVVVLELLELTDDDKKRENSILLHEGFLILGAPLMVVLVCFAYGVGAYIYREKNSPPPCQLAIWC